jgi:hypothetical protein
MLLYTLEKPTTLVVVTRAMVDGCQSMSR